MAAKIQIARVPIFLKNVNFLKILNPTEAHLIKPFLKQGAPANNFKKRGFLVDLKAIRNIKRPKDFKVSPELIKKIQSIFFNTNEKMFKNIFLIFAKRLLIFYLIDTQENKRRFVNLLNDTNDYSKLILNPYSCVIFNGRLRKADIVYMPVSIRDQKSELYSWPYHLNMLKLFFRMALNYRRDGILLHASSVEIGSQGFVFIGPGNSGKSTVARMLKPDRVFSDETAVIRKINNVYKIFSNPWWNGDNAMNIKINNPQKPAQLKAIFFIKKSEKTRLRRLKFKEALATLIYRDRSFQQAGFCDNKIGIKEFYTFSQDLLKNIPAFELNIKKGRRFKEKFAVLIKGVFKKKWMRPL